MTKHITRHRNQDFHNEWRTTGDHRYLITVRDGFPGSYERKMGRIAAGFLADQCSNARLMIIFHDDTHGCVNLFVGSTNPEDQKAAEELQRLLECLYEGRGATVHFELYPESKSKNSDHYSHMAYLLNRHDNPEVDQI